MSNIHGYCPNCKVDLDGEIIIESFINQGCDAEEAERMASHYSGWKQHGVDNKFGKAQGIYCIDKDRTVEWMCPDCKHTWSRF